MFGLLQPHEIGVIQQDICALVNGPDGCDCTMHWVSGDGPLDIYEKPAGEVEVVEVLRAHASPVDGRQVQRQRVADLPNGDLVLVFLPGVTLSGRPGLWFEVPGFGEFVPELKPVTQNVAGPLHLEVYCRPKR
jgi:hypothetical protein